MATSTESLERAEAACYASPLDARRADIIDGGKVRKRRVLVVDDDHECRLLLSAMVAKAGYDVDAVADGTMALAMMQALPPDVVLLDAQLPRRDGFDVCSVIKSDPRTSRTPVIMLTAYASDQARERALAAGADEFVTKPFVIEPLLALMTRLVEAGGAAPQAEAAAAGDLRVRR